MLAWLPACFFLIWGLTQRILIYLWRAYSCFLIHLAWSWETPTLNAWTRAHISRGRAPSDESPCHGPCKSAKSPPVLTRWDLWHRWRFSSTEKSALASPCMPFSISLQLFMSAIRLRIEHRDLAVSVSIKRCMCVDWGLARGPQPRMLAGYRHTEYCITRQTSIKLFILHLQLKGKWCIYNACGDSITKKSVTVYISSIFVTVLVLLKYQPRWIGPVNAPWRLSYPRTFYFSLHFGYPFIHL